jgi:very-short-patch-repair endonuclease
MSALEENLAFQIRALDLPRPEREFVFAKPRRWRFDFAWPLARLAVEVEGGTWGKSRHTTGAGFQGDCDKYNVAALQGWRVLRFTGKHIKTGEAIQSIQQGLNPCDQ